MNSKKDVICADEVVLAIIPPPVLFLNLRAEEEGQIENLEKAKEGEGSIFRQYQTVCPTPSINAMQAS